MQGGFLFPGISGKWHKNGDKTFLDWTKEQKLHLYFLPEAVELKILWLAFSSPPAPGVVTCVRRTWDGGHWAIMQLLYAG